MSAGRRPPTLCIWDWATNAVVIGRFQSVRNEVDLERAARHNVHVVRRIAGGGAMFVEPGNTITYSVYAPLALIAGKRAVESYAFFDQWELVALANLGVQAWYGPVNDITSPGGQVGGAAQIRRNTPVLHHVTMVYEIDTAKMLEVLRTGREKISDQGIASAARRVDPLRSQTGVSREQIIQQMIATFRDHYASKIPRSSRRRFVPPRSWSKQNCHRRLAQHPAVTLPAITLASERSSMSRPFC